MHRLLSSLAIIALTATGAFAAGKSHHIVIHIDQNDPGTMTLALNNLQNIEAFYKGNGDSVVAEVVAIGPGLVMYIEGQSPVADRIAAISADPGVTFAACGNTLRGMEQRAGHPIALIAQAKVVPSGAVRLVELQEQGYAYLKP